MIKETVSKAVKSNRKKTGYISDWDSAGRMEEVACQYSRFDDSKDGQLEAIAKSILKGF